MVPWVLAIDFGTSFSTGAVREVGSDRYEALEIDGARAMPSGVWVDGSGALVVGASAARQARLAPGRWERSPKRVLGDAAPLVLGEVQVPVVEAAAAVLSVIAEEAVRLMGSAPVSVRLTCPARWGQRRRGALLVAAGLAGLDTAGTGSLVLVEEPAAAAWFFATRGELPAGARVGVFDLGGGTFDAAVVRAAAPGEGGAPFVVEATGGIDGLGGERFDALLLQHVGEVVARRAPGVWEQVLGSPEPRWRVAAEDALREVRRGKEELSRYASVTLDLGPLVDVPVQLTRDEVESLLGPQVERAADELAATIARAGTRPAELAAVYLAGGSSRMPLVSRLVAQRLGVLPTTLGEPKTVVAAGAALWEEGSTVRTAPDPEDSGATRSVLLPAAQPVPEVVPGPDLTKPARVDPDRTRSASLPPHTEPEQTEPEPAGAAWWRRPAVTLSAAAVVLLAVGLGAFLLLRDEADPGRQVAGLAGVTASVNGADVVLRWDPFPGATSYRVSDVQDKTPQSAEVRVPSFTDTQTDGEEHTFYVYAYDAAGLTAASGSTTAKAQPWTTVQDIADDWPLVVPGAPKASGADGQTCQAYAPKSDTHARAFVACDYPDGVHLEVLVYPNRAERDARTAEVAAYAGVQRGVSTGRRPTLACPLAACTSGAYRWEDWQASSGGSYALYMTWQGHDVGAMDDWLDQKDLRAS